MELRNLGVSYGDNNDGDGGRRYLIILFKNMVH